jgi:thioredoxin 1
MTIVVTESNFEKKVLNAKKPALLVFRADWCSACKMLMPTLDGLSLTMEETLTVGKVDVEDNAALTQRMGIRGLPTMLLFRDGKELARKVGAVSDAKLYDFLGDNLEL